jgi:NADPH-dependent 2,4-dienoyl-CoA reductase/sulfur reductase-like enzyme
MSDVWLRLDGRPVAARAGQSVAAALLDAGHWTLTRSSKYRRPRGIHCAAGHCANCLLRIDGAAHVRACMTTVRDGMDVRTEGAVARRFDPLRAIDRAGRLFPVGFQYRYFKRQNAAWRIWERRLRHAAAETAIPAPFEVPPAERLTADLLVVGGGVAGIGAASAAARAGLRVVLASRRGRLGGRLGARVAAVVPEAALHAVEHDVAVLRATAIAAFGDRYVLDAGSHAIEVTARASVLATGAYERALPFAGNDRPGVMLTSAIHRLAIDDGVLRGATAVLVAIDDAVQAMADDLEAAGVRIAEIVDPRAEPVAALGRGRVRALRIGGRTVRCDVVGMSGGWQPADELRYIATSAGDAVVTGERARPLGGELTVLQAVGAVAGTRDPAAAFAEGERAGALAEAARA